MTTIDERVGQTWFELSALLPDIPSTWDIAMVNSACRDILAAAFRHAVEDEREACAQICDGMANERQKQFDDPRYDAHTKLYFRDMQAAYQYASKAIRARTSEVQ